MDNFNKLIEQSARLMQQGIQQGAGDSGEVITEVTTENVFSRLSNSIAGIVVGIFLVVAGCALSYWNEGNYVRRLQSLAEGKGAVISIGSDKVDAGNEGRLVHLSGPVTVEPDLVDEEFAVEAAEALSLSRSVEMYQWKQNVKEEKKKKVGGSVQTTRTYSYEQVWSSQPISSSAFKQPAGHANPGNWRFKSQEFKAREARVGAFNISPGSLPGSEQPVTLEAAAAERAEKRGFQVDGSQLYLGKDPAHPEIGDIRVHFSARAPIPVSVVAQQNRSGLGPYVAKSGGKSIFEVRAGEVPAEQMFQAMEQSNHSWLWGLRFLGWFLVCGGISKVLEPLVVMADVVPFVGSLVGAGVNAVALAVGTPLVLVFMAIGWLAARPLVAVVLLGGAVLLTVAAAAALFKLRARTA